MKTGNFMHKTNNTLHRTGRHVMILVMYLLFCRQIWKFMKQKIKYIGAIFKNVRVCCDCKYTLNFIINLDTLSQKNTIAFLAV